MGPTWVLSAPDGPHVDPMNLAIRGVPLVQHKLSSLLEDNVRRGCLHLNQARNPQVNTSLRFLSHHLETRMFCLSLQGCKTQFNVYYVMIRYEYFNTSQAGPQALELAI